MCLMCILKVAVVPVTTRIVPIPYILITNACTVDVGYKHTGYKNISDIRTLYWKTVPYIPI